VPEARLKFLFNFIPTHVAAGLFVCPRTDSLAKSPPWNSYTSLLKTISRFSGYRVENYIRSVEGATQILFYTSPACFNILPKRALSPDQLTPMTDNIHLFRSTAQGRR
jgi:hypothetical protein